MIYNVPASVSHNDAICDSIERYIAKNHHPNPAIAEPGNHRSIQDAMMAIFRIDILEGMLEPFMAHGGP